jgi:hypothetical protein
VLVPYCFVFGHREPKHNIDSYYVDFLVRASSEDGVYRSKMVVRRGGLYTLGDRKRHLRSTVCCEDGLQFPTKQQWLAKSAKQYVKWEDCDDGTHERFILMMTPIMNLPQKDVVQCGQFVAAGALHCGTYSGSRGFRIED